MTGLVYHGILLISLLEWIVLRKSGRAYEMQTALIDTAA
jgi:hypothetical protein